MNTNRTIRVFISSTFRDMQAERDYLVKFTFPELRKLCELRGVTWGEVDLRWGITDEERAEGKVLPLCLEEIQRCRPYFIGLLGERYGWIPDSIALEVIEREAWLREHLDERRSVTELEILHGVLNKPEMANHAFFYFRDPKYAAQAAIEQLDDCIPEDAESAAKLMALKERIRHSGFPVRERYADPKAVGELVLKDFTELVESLFPVGQEPAPLDREAADHESFAQSRARVYVGRQEYFDRLDEHVQGGGPPLVVLGESGSGKSALLANWSAKYRETHPASLVIQHYIAATPFSANWAAMLRRIMSEFKRRFDIKQEIPNESNELRAAFANWLHIVAARGKVVLILDALNQLEDRDGALDLVWLPQVVPENIRIILSTLAGPSSDNLKKRGWPSLNIKPLELDERQVLITNYLAQYTKSLAAEQSERIARASQTANPLYLCALLEELRIYGDHLTLDRRIQHYLAAGTVIDLYEKILERYEQDYETERSRLVCDAMSLLWAARRGLSESELMDLLGRNGEPLPRAYWSPLLRAVEHAIVNTSGLLGFSHNYLRQAVERRYLATHTSRQLSHVRLARYFAGEVPTPRQVDELPWQLEQAEQWQLLFDLLAYIPFLATAVENNEFEVKAYWAQVEGKSSLRMIDAYQPLIEAVTSSQPEREHIAALALVEMLLFDKGKHQEALRLSEACVGYYRAAGDLERLQASLSLQAVALQSEGNLEGAMKLHQEQAQICRRIGDQNGLQIALGHQALVLHRRGETSAAVALSKQQEKICRALGERSALAGCLGNRALMLRVRGDFDGALKLHGEEEQLCREQQDRNGLQRTFGNQALVLMAQAKYESALELCRQQEQICRELGSLSDMVGCLGNQAAILYRLDNQPAALSLILESEQNCRQTGNPTELATCLANGAKLLSDDDPEAALAFAQEAFDVASAHGLSNIVEVMEPALQTLRARIPNRT